MNNHKRNSECKGPFRVVNVITEDFPDYKKDSNIRSYLREYDSGVGDGKPNIISHSVQLSELITFLLYALLFTSSHTMCNGSLLYI